MYNCVIVKKLLYLFQDAKASFCLHSVLILLASFFMKLYILPQQQNVIKNKCELQAQLEKLQNEISQIAKKTGISSATKLALIAKSEGLCDEIPQMEWWDSVILVDNLDTMKDGKIAIKDDVINTLVEHPTQMRCPSK